jgi:leucyl-tRNA synthetase
VDVRAHKMSKSRGNVVNPDDMVAQHSADALRLYEMFMGDFEQPKPWDPKAVMGVVRFLQNVWRVMEEPKPASGDPNERLRHKTIRTVGERIEGLKFNTAIAALMEYTNALGAQGATRADQEALAKLVAPLAPHLAEEAWEKLGHATLVCKEPWPAYDPALTVDQTVTIPVQVSGKTRGTVDVPRGADEATVRAAAMELPTVANAVEGKTMVRVVFIPDRMLNLVVK